VARSFRLFWRLAAPLALLAVPVLTGCAKDKSPTKPVASSGTRAVQVKVRFGNGDPARDVLVDLSKHLLPLGSADPDFFLQVLESDSAGEVRFTQVPPGGFGVYADVGFDSLAVGTTLDLAAVPSPPDTILPPLTLVRACVAKGRALRPAGSDHSGIIVLLDGLLVAEATDGDGSYRLTAVPPGTWNLLAIDSTGYATASVALASPGDSVALADLTLRPIARFARVAPAVVERAAALARRTAAARAHPGGRRPFRSAGHE